jgi:myo-inositol-1(or 4)-monophosphatase
MKDVVVPLARDLGRWANDESERHYLGDHDLGVSAKTTPGDVVTIADREVQRRLVSALREAFPGFGFVGEEGLDEPEEGAPTWVIDPIDGTHNFVRAYPGFSVSVALIERGDGALGVIYDSVTDEVYWAVRGGGAWCGDRRLRIGDRADLSRALITTNFTAASAADAEHQRFAALLSSRAAGFRSSGSACRDFCLVAAGKVDLFWQFGIQSWDVAAGVALVREAGGTFAFADTPADWVRSSGVSMFAGAPGVVAAAMELAGDLARREPA